MEACNQSDDIKFVSAFQVAIASRIPHIWHFNDKRNVQRRAPFLGFNRGELSTGLCFFAGLSAPVTLVCLCVFFTTVELLLFSLQADDSLFKELVDFDLLCWASFGDLVWPSVIWFESLVCALAMFVWPSGLAVFLELRFESASFPPAKDMVCIISTNCKQNLSLARETWQL